MKTRQCPECKGSGEKGCFQCTKPDREKANGHVCIVCDGTKKVICTTCNGLGVVPDI